MKLVRGELGAITERNPAVMEAKCRNEQCREFYRPANSSQERQMAR